MPVDDREPSVRLQDVADSARQARTIRNTVEGIRHEDEVNRSARETGKLIGIAREKLAVAHATFFKARAGDFQQSLINVDSDDVPGDLGNLQGEPAVP